jgi:Hydantoinase B/oxoprolinase
MVSIFGVSGIVAELKSRRYIFYQTGLPYPTSIMSLQTDPSKGPDPIILTLFANRFMGIAEAMGRSLRQTSISTNIKERLDYSCALFAPDGDLVANAPFIPIHLGSMSLCVSSLS